MDSVVFEDYGRQKVMNRSIAVIAHNCKNGGAVGAVAWRQVIELSRYFQVFVITRDIPEPPNNNIYPVLLRPRQWNFLRRFCHVPNELSFQATARNVLQDLCQKTDISVVWCHSHATSFLAAYPASKRYGFKIIMTTHGDIFERPKRTYDHLLTYYYKACTRPAYRHSDHVQVLSPFMADWAVRNGTEEDKVSVIPTGIDTEDIGIQESVPRTTETFLRDNIFHILFVGSMLPVKGIDLLIKSAALLKSLKIDIKITIVGGGPERDNLQTLSESFSLENIIEFVGKSPRNDLYKYYQSADVLCVPSRSEPLATVILEAFAMGLPVVGSNTGGTPFLLKNGHRGFLFQNGDANSLCNALVCAQKNREHLVQLSRECQAAAVNEFSWVITGKSLRNLVNSVLRVC